MPSRRATLRSLSVFVLVSLASLGAGSATADPDPATYYVSLGDSLARGWQPDASGHSRDTDQGYVDVVAAGLRKRHPGIKSIKFGCPGETTATMASGGTCRYGAGSQLAQAEAFLRAHRGRVTAVTVNIGDNDVERCLTHARIDAACVRRELLSVRSRMPRIVARLRTAAGSGVPLAGLTDYDQFLSFWLDGRSGQSLARRSVRVVDRLNRSADLIYRRGGARVADATAAFATLDLTHFVNLRGRGRVPLAVQRVCLWTWACSPPPIGANDHANAAGYRVLGRVLLAALGR